MNLHKELTIMNYILSPCGTSLLTNIAKEMPELNSMKKVNIFEESNKKNRGDIDHETLKILDIIIAKTRDELAVADHQKVMAMSAELNSILRLYPNHTPNQQDHHLLLSTDTWLGEETAKLVQIWLEKNNQIVVIHRQTDLQTKDLVAFQTALSDLIKYLTDEIPSFKKSGYHIIFNLTGGFKSVQGFLQSIANFYADETVYIFESSPELLRIPKLPIKLDANVIIEKNANIFRKMALGITLLSTEVTGIPETLLLNIDGEVTLSPWGELLWSQAKQEIYQKLLDEPINRIRYTENFKENFNLLPKERKQLINQRVDQLFANLERGENPKSFDLKPLKSKEKKPSTYEIDAWSDGDAKRIFGHYEDNVFILDSIDKALH
jgi:putative CRISPR-associated protein (TIGR02619 family)